MYIEFWNFFAESLMFPTSLDITFLQCWYRFVMSIGDFLPFSAFSSFFEFFGRIKQGRNKVKIYFILNIHYFLSTALFSLKNWNKMNITFLINYVQFFDDQNIQIIGGMQPSYLWIYFSSPSPEIGTPVLLPLLKLVSCSEFRAVIII